MLAFIFYLLIAAVCAFIAGKLVPGIIPGGFFASAVIGVIGAWLGSSMLGSVGPALAGVSLLPCILGSAVLVFAFSLLSGGFRRGA